MMRAVLPRITVGGWSACDAQDDTYEGGYLCITWLGFMVEIGAGRREADRS